MQITGPVTVVKVSVAARCGGRPWVKFDRYFSFPGVRHDLILDAAAAR